MPVELWQVGLVASAIITVSFAAIAVRLGMDLRRTGQWSENPLGVATMLIFVTCAASHGVRSLQLLGPVLGVGGLPGLASHVEYNWAHMVVLDLLTAFAGVWYWTMRKRYPMLARGASMFEDLRSRNRQALAVHDNIVQGLSRTKLALEAEEDELGEEALEETLEAAKGMITDLVDEEQLEGSLRRGDD